MVVKKSSAVLKIIKVLNVLDNFPFLQILRNLSDYDINFVHILRQHFERLRLIFAYQFS